MTTSTHAPTRALLVIPLLAACYGDPTGVSTQEIHNGTTATAADAEQNGIVSINGSVGVLIRNEWVLASMYAVTGAARLNPTTLTVTMGTQSARVRSLHVWSEGLTTTHAMLIRLQTPLTVAGQSSGYQRSFTGLSSSYGGRVICWGAVAMIPTGWTPGRCDMTRAT